jgi:hypothetical protein
VRQERTRAAIATEAQRLVVASPSGRSNALLAELGDRLGLGWDEGVVRLGDREWRGREVALIAVLPHPDGGDRYAAVHGGATPDAIVHGAHLHWQLLPDYLVYDGDRVLEWGTSTTHGDRRRRETPQARPAVNPVHRSRPPPTSSGAPAARKQGARKPWTLQRTRCTALVSFIYPLVPLATPTDGRPDDVLPCRPAGLARSAPRSRAAM